MDQPTCCPLQEISQILRSHSDVNTNDVTIPLQAACSIAEHCTCPRCKCKDLRESVACKQMEDSKPDGAAMTFVPGKGSGSDKK